MQRAIFNKSWRQHPTKHQLYGHLPLITKTIEVRRTRHAGHCWRSKDELISDVLLWIPTYGRAKAGRPARTNIQQLCEDTGCCPEDLPEAMNDREEWQERIRNIRAGGSTWWWWLLLRVKCQGVKSRERNSTKPYISVEQLMKRELSSRPRLLSPTWLTLLYIYIYIYIYIWRNGRFGGIWQDDKNKRKCGLIRHLNRAK